MANLATCKEIAKLWNISERRVAILCKEGRLPGAAKVQGQWLIPSDVEKPVDARLHGGNYRKTKSAWLDMRNPMVMGLSDYGRASSGYHYVDKTMVIKEFLDNRAALTLFVRPQGFGKSLTMDMLRTFFEHSEKDTAALFRYKKIWATEAQYRRHQGKYPVIALSFKDFDFPNWEDALEKMKLLIRSEFGRHAILSFSPRCSAFQKAYYESVINNTASNVDLMSSLACLTQMLAEHYGVEPVVFIDDYDKPMRAAKKGAYEMQMAAFLKNFYGGCFKDNPCLSFGFMAGETYTEEDGVVSSLGNVMVCAQDSPRYATGFGFSLEELEVLADYYLPVVSEEEADQESLQMLRDNQVKLLAEKIEKLYGSVQISGKTMSDPWNTASFFNAMLSAQLNKQFSYENMETLLINYRK